jgi:hypothetical protein
LALDEGLLDRVQASFWRSKSLHRSDLRTLHLSDKDQARAHGPTVDKHSAGTAFAHAATFFRPGHA